ncbi:condensation domain-containing protein, partial [Streptomyces sp. NPDC002920]
MQKTPHPVPAVPTRVRLASFAQQRLWFLAQLPGANAAYNETIAFTLTGPLDRDVLSRTFDALADRHETLRTRLVAEEGVVRQHVDPPGAGFALAFGDLTAVIDLDARVATLQLDEAERPFDLAAGPLGRGRLLAVGPERHLLLLTFHHSIYDGASMDVMMDEVGRIYRAFSTGGANPLPALARQYADHALAQHEAVLGGGLGGQEDYWVRALHDAPPVLELPTDRPRPARQHYEGGRAEFGLDAEVTAGLRALARQHGATPFVALLT